MRPAEGFARALFSAAQQCEAIETVHRELGPIAEVMSTLPEFFFSPEVSANEMAAVLEGALAGKADPLTLAFLVMLARRRRMKLLPECCVHFETMVRKHLALATVKLSIPYEPDTAMLDGILDFLTGRGLIPEAARRTAKVEVTVDSALMGGFIAEQGEHSIDLSLRSKLQTLHKNKLVM